MDNTIIEFPHEGLRNGNKVAKLSTVKRDKLVLKYNTSLAEYQANAQSVSSTQPVNTEVVKAESNMLDNIVVVDFSNNCRKNGIRKLKVSRVVANKSRMYYNRNVVRTMINDIVPSSNMNDKVEPSLSDTRMSRLERTGELNKIDLKEEPTNNVINTPERFMEKEIVNPYESLINDRENAPLTRESMHTEEKPVEQNMGGDPNLYTKLVHGKEEDFSNDEIGVKLKDAITRLDIANEEKEKARAVNASLEAEVATVRETLDKLKKKKELQEQKVLEDTLNMLKSAKEEILDETRKYDNLQEELKALIRERDALLKNPYVNQDDENYAARRAA